MSSNIHGQATPARSKAKQEYSMCYSMREVTRFLKFRVGRKRNMETYPPDRWTPRQNVRMKLRCKLTLFAGQNAAYRLT